MTHDKQKLYDDMNKKIDLLIAQIAENNKQFKENTGILESLKTKSIKLENNLKHFDLLLQEYCEYNKKVLPSTFVTPVTIPKPPPVPPPPPLFNLFNSTPISAVTNRATKKCLEVKSNITHHRPPITEEALRQVKLKKTGVRIRNNN